MNAASLPKNRAAALWVPLAIAVSATLFLFYIDEGYYDFRWMADAGNWVAFALYIGIILGMQLLLGWLFFRKMEGFRRGLYTGLLGLLLGVAFAFWLFS